MKFIRRILFKRKVLAELERGAWQHNISAAYSDAVAPDLEKLIAAEKERIEEHRQKIAELEQSTAYNNRQERKALEGEVNVAEAKIKEFERQVEAVRREAATLRAQAAEKLVRREFFKAQFSIWK